MIAAIAATVQSNALTRGPGELSQHLRRHGFLARVLEHGPCPVGIDHGLIADGLEAVDTVFQRRVIQVGDARLYGVVQTLEPQF